MSTNAQTQEHKLRRKGSIGDWFVTACIVAFLSILVINITNDNVITSATHTIEKMLAKSKQAPSR